MARNAYKRSRDLVGMDHGPWPSLPQHWNCYPTHLPSHRFELMLQMDFQIYPDNLMSLLFRTPLMMVDSIRVWTESSRMLDFSGSDRQRHTVKKFHFRVPQKRTHICFNFVRKKCVCALFSFSIDSGLLASDKNRTV